jgi:hypothetical protein
MRIRSARPAARTGPLPDRSGPIAALLAAAALLAGPVMSAEAQVDPPPTGFQVGQPFPVIELPSLEDGEPRSIADFRGHRVILHVFASW